jgi:beta-glucosidase
VTPTGGWQNWTSVTVAAGGATGVHRLYLTFTGATSADFVNVNWFQFAH